MSKYSQRIEALENNEKKKKRIFTGIVVILIVFFLGGMVLGAQNVLNTEGVFDPYAETATEPIPVVLTPEEIVSRFSKAMSEIGDPDTVRLSVYTDVEVPDESVSFASGDESLVTEINYIKPKILEKIKEYYGMNEMKFGEDYSEHTIPVAFTAKDVEGVECFRGRLGDDGSLVDTDTCFYKVFFPVTDFNSVESTPLFKSFGMDVSERISDTFIADISEIAAVDNAEMSCKDFEINFETDANSGRIKTVWYIRGYSVKLTLGFKGDLSALGTQTLSFDFYAKESHWYTWAGLRFSSETLSMEKGDVEAIEAFKTADDEVTVTWSSSNPEVASVDDKGYVKGKSTSSEPVTITASFDYRGNTYTDSCTVFVRKPVTEIKVSEREILLKPGEKFTLTAEIKPKKATIKGILWFTEDEKVATVDENGNITAVGRGETKVFAIAEDGYFRSSCTVTVGTEKEGSK